MEKDYFIQKIKHCIDSGEFWRADFLPIPLKLAHEWLMEIGMEIQSYEMPYGFEIKTLLNFNGKKYIFCFSAFEGGFYFRRNTAFFYLFDIGHFEPTDLFRDENSIYYCKEHNIIIEVDQSCLMNYCPHCRMSRGNLTRAPDGEHDCILNYCDKDGEYRTKYLFRALIKDKTISKIEN